VQRYIAEVFGRRRGRESTVRVADGEPGDELQVDFGRLGFIGEPMTGRRRVVHALIFTACFSRHCFVWLTFQQTTAAVIAGCEAAWAFFGGVFRTLIPDYAPRRIIGVVFPPALCGRRRRGGVITPENGRGASPEGT
jgi:transposase